MRVEFCVYLLALPSKDDAVHHPRQFLSPQISYARNSFYLVLEKPANASEVLTVLADLKAAASAESITVVFNEVDEIWVFARFAFNVKAGSFEVGY